MMPWLPSAFKTPASFIASACRASTSSRIVDGVYEYDKVGLPFFGELGRAVLRYEWARMGR